VTFYISALEILLLT